MRRARPPAEQLLSPSCDELDRLLSSCSHLLLGWFLLVLFSLFCKLPSAFPLCPLATAPTPAGHSCFMEAAAPAVTPRKEDCGESGICDRRETGSSFSKRMCLTGRILTASCHKGGIHTHCLRCCHASCCFSIGRKTNMTSMTSMT